jgi:hypothetical protein
VSRRKGREGREAMGWDPTTTNPRPQSQHKQKTKKQKSQKQRALLVHARTRRLKERRGRVGYCMCVCVWCCLCSHVAPISQTHSCLSCFLCMYNGEVMGRIVLRNPPFLPPLIYSERCSLPPSLSSRIQPQVNVSSCVHKVALSFRVTTTGS